MEINIWNCFNISKISVDLNTKFKNGIRDKIKNDRYPIAKKIGIAPARLYDYFIYQTSTIPLNILLDLSKTIQITKRDIEMNICLYKQKTVPLKNSIRSPKLPIKIDPYFTSIISHLFFDGSMPRDGKGTYYNQKDKKIMQDFIEKIKLVFGDVQYSVREDHRGVLKCRIPRLIGEICKYVYQVDSFGTFDAKIPKKVFDLNKNHKIAFILTAILDEGSIAYDGSIQFGVSNKLMMEDFRRLCEDIGLATKPIRQTKKGGHYYTYLLSTKKFQEIIEKFNKKYPQISLRYKGERLKKALEIKNQEFFYTKSFADKRKKIILEELNRKPQSINYLANKFLIPPRTIRRYMYKLMNENRIKRKKVKNEYVYSITPLVKGHL
jgi:predicted transcriptional regulator